MPDIKTYIRQPEDVSKSPERLDREKMLQGWDRNKAEKIAEQEKLVLTDEHMAFINYLQKSFVQNGWPQYSHELTQRLDSDFADKGGKRYLYKLFPNGPVVQGCRIAGLPAPDNATNASFGSIQ